MGFNESPNKLSDNFKTARVLYNVNNSKMSATKLSYQYNLEFNQQPTI